MHPPRPDLTAAQWRASSYSNSNGGQCVEVADGFTNLTPVRDSKTPHSAALVLPNASWSSFVSAVKTDGFNA